MGVFEALKKSHRSALIDSYPLNCSLVRRLKASAQEVSASLSWKWVGGTTFQSRDAFQTGQVYGLGTRKRVSLKWFLAGTRTSGVWGDLRVFLLSQRRNNTKCRELGVLLPQGVPCNWGWSVLNPILCSNQMEPHTLTKKDCSDVVLIKRQLGRSHLHAQGQTGYLSEAVCEQEWRNMGQGVNRPLEWKNSRED